MEILKHPSPKLTLLSFLLISIVCLIIFIPSFNKPLYAETYVSLQYELKNAFNITQFFSKYYGNAWKPLPRIGYYLEYHLFGLDAVGYRITNLLFHISISFLVFYISLLIVRNKIISLAIALIFAAHFAHWEIAAHTNILHHFLMIIFYLTTLILFQKYIISRKKIFYAATLCSFIFCMLSSQTSISLVIVMIALEMMMNEYKLTDIFRLKNYSKYIPFLSLTMIHILLTLALQMEEGARHNPFVNTGRLTFTIYAPIIKNFYMYITELFFPIISSKMPGVLKKFLFMGVVFIFFILFIKGSKAIRFCIFWLIASQFIFLFWNWPNPMPRYTYLSSIPFSILIGLLLLEVFKKTLNYRIWKSVTKITAIIGISLFVFANCTAHYIVQRVKIFHTPGINSLELLDNFYDLYPDIENDTLIYFSNMPKKDFFTYGCWSNEDLLEGFLMLFFKKNITVKFLEQEEMKSTLLASGNKKNIFYIEFKSGRLYDVGPSKVP